MQRPLEERDSFLEEACAGADEARREIAALLAADREAGEFLDSGPFQDGSPRAGEVPGAGTLVGPYRLVRKLGEGGIDFNAVSMGRVSPSVFMPVHTPNRLSIRQNSTSGT